VIVERWCGIEVGWEVMRRQAMNSNHNNQGIHGLSGGFALLLLNAFSVLYLPLLIPSLLCTTTTTTTTSTLNHFHTIFFYCSTTL
jgi:hypothetical protein